jgi:hypothetical protein
VTGFLRLTIHDICRIFDHKKRTLNMMDLTTINQLSSKRGPLLKLTLLVSAAMASFTFQQIMTGRRQLAAIPVFPVLDEVAFAVSEHQEDQSEILRDINIVMMGDCMTRYQYLSLAYRLRYGVWFDDSKWYYHLVNEMSFRSPFNGNTWSEFLFHTNNILQPNEICDCRRAPMNDKNWKQSLLENRYFYDPILNNSLVFIFAMGHEVPVRGRLMPNETRIQSKDLFFKSIKDFRARVVWEYSDWADVVRHYIRKLDPQPRHIVMNAGYWPHNFGWSKPPAFNESGELSQETQNLTKVIMENPQYEFVWKTTTYNREGSLPDNKTSDEVMCEQFQTCLNISFTMKFRRDVFWDWVHLLEPSYRMINEVMLDQLGYLPASYSPMNASVVF